MFAAIILNFPCTQINVCGHNIDFRGCKTIVCYRKICVHGNNIVFGTANECFRIFPHLGKHISVSGTPKKDSGH